ncbi:MAG TPA: HD-GYP domain-containing protein [Peptococcaceae bacterium]|nr:HD-GYP domain-containing protein [Peptococcaceae bacterium]
MKIRSIQKVSNRLTKLSYRSIHENFNTVIQSFENLQKLSYSDFNKKLFNDVFKLIPEAEKGSCYRLEGDRFVPMFSSGYDEVVLSKLSFSIEDLFIDFECSTEQEIETKQIYIQQRDTRRFNSETVQIFKALGTFENFASLYAPLKANGIIIGLICLENFTKRTFSEQSLRTLKFYANLISSRIKNHINQDRLTQMHYETISALVSAIEINDPYTEGHGRRVGFYAKHIAEMMNFSQDIVSDIETAGLLHDIGKLGIPTEMLNKPGKLSETELSIIKEHPRNTWKVLKKVSGLDRVSEYAYCHHENYDGSGYPRGLKFDKIPFASQILAVADTFDAMTSGRSYRNALSVNEAIDYIRTQSGKKFDPEIARIVPEMLPLIHSIFSATAIE